MKFGITGNPNKLEFYSILNKLCLILDDTDHQFFISADLNFNKNYEIKSKLQKKTLEDISKDCDMIISIGGDGTILSTFRQVAPFEIPIFGIHIGGLGFLNEINKTNLNDSLKYILNNDFIIEKRMSLKININNDDSLVHYSLNDIVIDNGSSPRALQFNVFLSENFLNTYISDGIIFCTPTGSTAYSLSAGGTIITPNLNVIGVTPICPHSLSARPIIISDNEKIKVQLSEENVGMAVSIDGQVHIPVDYTNQIYIERSKFDAHLVRLPSNDYYSTLRTKMGWSGNFR